MSVYPFRYGTIGAYGPVAEWINAHCFFTKMNGTVPLFIGPVSFFLCRVNAPEISNSQLFVLHRGSCGFDFSFSFMA